MILTKYLYSLLAIAFALNTQAQMSDQDFMQRCQKQYPNYSHAIYHPATKTLCINGLIDSTTLYAFEDDFAPRDVETVILNSTGGTFLGGMDLSQYIRDHHITTVIPEGFKCMSNCVWAFAAGTSRYASKKSIIGIHFVYEITSIPHKVMVNLVLSQQYLQGIDDYADSNVSHHYILWAKQNGLTQEISAHGALVHETFVQRSFWTPSIKMLYDIGLVTHIN